MANTLSTEKQGLAVSMLCEGNSIRSVEWMTGIHRDTVMRLVHAAGIVPVQQHRNSESKLGHHPKPG